MLDALDIELIIDTLDRVSISSATDFNTLTNNLDVSKPVFVDTETTRLYGGIRLVQLNQEHWSLPMVFDTKTTPLDELYAIIKDCHVVFHNISFDTACFENDLGLDSIAFKKFDDTLILAKLALFDELDSFSLDSCFELLCKTDIYEIVLKHFNTDHKKLTKSIMQKSFVSTKTRDGSSIEISKVQLAYSALDVLLLPNLYAKCKESFRAESQWIYDLDKLFIKYASKWSKFGIPINRELLEQERLEATETLVASQTRLNEIAGTEVNVNSNIQMKNVLGLHCTDKLTLKQEILKGNEKAKLVFEIRRLLKRLNFLDRYTSSTGRIRGYFAPLTASGRAMCSGSGLEGSDNIMQIPRNLKHLVGYPDNDERCIVYGDFAQLELRTACAEQGDEVLFKLFSEGKDLHRYAGSQIYNIPESEITPEQRTMAKFSNFCLLYLGSAKMFRAVVTEMGDREPPSEKECERIVKVWRSIYPQIAEWHKRLLNKFTRGDMINRTLNGRYFKAKLYTDLAAIQNQGLGAEVAKLTIHYLFKKKPDLKLLDFVHDSFIIDAKNLEEGKELAKLLGDTMVEAWVAITKNCKISNLAMPTEVGVYKQLEHNALYTYKNEGY